MTTRQKMHYASIQSLIIGFVVISYEILLSRLFSPFIGSNVITWSVNISCVLAGLCLGSYFQLKSFSRFVGFAQVASFILIICAAKGASLFFRTSLSFSLGYTGIVIGLYLLFGFLPNVVWGYFYSSLFRESSKETTIPLLIINSIGNILGAIAIQVLMLSFANILLEHVLFLILVLSVLLAYNYNKTQKRIPTLGLAVILLAILFQNSLSNPSFFPKMRISEKFDTLYHRVQIFSSADDLSVATSVVGLQTHLSKSKMPHGEVLHAFTMNSGINKVLLLGTAAGGMLHQIGKITYESSRLQITAIEIDKEMHQKISSLNTLPVDLKVEYVYEDARFFLNTTTESFDLIIMDAYQEFSPPHHLITKEFYEQVKKKLNPDGIFFINLLAFYEPEFTNKSRFFYRNIQTLKECFDGFTMKVKSNSKISIGLTNFSIFITNIQTQKNEWELALPSIISAKSYTDQKEDSFIDVFNYF